MRAYPHVKRPSVVIVDEPASQSLRRAARLGSVTASKLQRLQVGLERGT